MYPALVSQFVLMMLATSIMSEISAEELTAIGYQIQSQTFRGFEVYLVIAVIYLFLSWLLRIVMNACYDMAFPRSRDIRKGAKKTSQGVQSGFSVLLSAIGLSYCWSPDGNYLFIC